MSRRLEIGVVMGLLVACALVYSPIWDNDFVNFDDDLFIYQNELIRSLEWPAIERLFELQIMTPYYKPLVYLSWALEYRFFGLNPRAYHLNNLLLHLANVVLVCVLLGLLWRARSKPGAAVWWAVFLVAALFALHPMKVESVAWATERKDVLFGFFFLSSLLSYALYVTKRRTVFLAASCLLFLLGTLSKAAIVSLPPALLLVDVLLERRDWRRLILDKVPYAVILVCALGAYGLLFRTTAPAPHPSRGALLMAAADPAARHLPAAGVNIAEGGDWRSGSRMIAVGYRVFGFAGHLLWPHDLSVIYPVPPFSSETPVKGQVMASVGLVILVVTLLGLLWRWPVVGAGGLFFLLTLAPVLAGPAFGTNFLSDRYTYIPSIGFWVVIVALLSALAGALTWARPVVAVMASLYVVGLSVSTFQQVGAWKSSETLWSAVIERQGEMPVALNSRGVVLKEDGDPASALADFDRALELDPFHFKAYSNRALIRHELGDPIGALADLDRAIELRPEVALLYINRGVVAVDAGHIVSGVRDYSHAIALEPSLSEAFLLRGIAKQKLGDSDGAIADFDRVLEMSGDTVEALLQRGAALMHTGDHAGAVRDTSLALERSPRDPRAFNNRGFARFYLGQLDLALQDLDQAILLDSSYPIAYRNRGDVRSALGDLEAGCADWRTAERLGAPESGERRAEFCPGEGGDSGRHR